MYDASFTSVFFFKQKTAYEMRISDWSSDVCSSDLQLQESAGRHQAAGARALQEVDVEAGGDRQRHLAEGAQQRRIHGEVGQRHLRRAAEGAAGADMGVAGRQAHAGGAEADLLGDAAVDLLERRALEIGRAHV